MDVTWVVVADSSRARLFALGQQNQLGELQDFVNLDAQVEKRLSHALARDVASMNVPRLEAYLQQALDRSGGAG